MNFLEAHRILKGFAGGPELPVNLLMSGTAEPLLVYLRAAAAARQRTAVIEALPFGVLAQTLRQPQARSPEVTLLLPWDFVPEADWRSGIAASAPDADAIRNEIHATAALLARRDAKRLYLPAPLPPIGLRPQATEALETALRAAALDLGAELLPPEAFSLGAYLDTGCPVGGQHLGDVATRMVELLTSGPKPSAKVLVTDLDQTLWHGVVGDDGLESLAFGPEGRGFPHFLYQTMLRRMRDEGVLLAAVSKNEREVALAPLKSGRMTLTEADFVAVMASWNPKSAQIREIAAQLNLGLDSMVFVDDNELELAEVAAALPQVATLPFPRRTQDLPALLEALATRFQRDAVTSEDRARTELYRRRLESMVPVEAAGADLRGFLVGLQMRLVLHDRTTGDRTRAVQLINKTNQFNLNGRRFDDAEVAAILEQGGRLVTATLEDRTGSHGEILACLMDRSGVVRALVMSCRVTNRFVEHATFAWLASRATPPATFAYEPTEKNALARAFLQDTLGADTDQPAEIAFDRDAFLRAHGDDALTLFTVVPPAGGDAQPS